MSDINSEPFIQRLQKRWTISVLHTFLNDPEHRYCKWELQAVARVSGVPLGKILDELISKNWLEWSNVNNCGVNCRVHYWLNLQAINQVRDYMEELSRQLEASRT